MKIIGITGGVGAGKSTVLDYLEKEYQAEVIQADKAGHKVMEPGEECYLPVIRLFGKEIIKSDKTIDRRRVSDVVFSQPELLEKLNAVIHPAVRRFILRRIAQCGEQGVRLCVVEAALLLEENYQEFCDAVWYIHTDTEIRIKRLMDSRGYTRQKAEEIIASQAPEGFFRAHADYTIENNGSWGDTCRQIDEGVRRYETL